MCSFALRIIGSRFKITSTTGDESLALQALRRRLQQLGHSQHLSRWPLASHLGTERLNGLAHMIKWPHVAACCCHASPC